MDYKRNSDPHYYESHCLASNCGSFALNLQGWYDPELYFEMGHGDIADWIEEVDYEGWTDIEKSDFYADVLIDGMLIEFADELRILNSEKDDLYVDEELIAFRTYCIMEEEEGWEPYPRWDFHFRVFRDGRWQEKQGDNPVNNECNIEDWGKYISEIYYFADKVILEENDE